MRGIDNGWEKTPKIRQSMLGYNRLSVVNRPATQYPPPDFQYETLYLDSSAGTLVQDAPSVQGTVRYQADSSNDEGCHFTYKFDQYTELCGITKAKLYMSTTEHDDMVRPRLLE